MKPLSQRFPIFIETLFTIAKTGKSPKQVSLDEQSNKENMNKYLQNFKNSTIKLLEDNTEKKICRLGSGKDFFLR